MPPLSGKAIPPRRAEPQAGVGHTHGCPGGPAPGLGAPAQRAGPRGNAVAALRPTPGSAEAAQAAQPQDAARLASPPSPVCLALEPGTAWVTPWQQGVGPAGLNRRLGVRRASWRPFPEESHHCGEELWLEADPRGRRRRLGGRAEGGGRRARGGLSRGS